MVFGGLMGLQVPQLSAGQPTPWMGLTERVNIYATMLWFAVLSAALVRMQKGRPASPAGRWFSSSA
jgi:hypothetical protein